MFIPVASFIFFTYAGSALKHLSQVKEEGGNEGGSDGDSYKNSGDDTSESDDGDEGEDEDEDDDAIASDQLSDDGDSKRPSHGIPSPQ